MIFTKIGIQNYRAIENLEYEPLHKIACLAGDNGRGKSSFFSALYTGLTGNIDKSNVQNGKEEAQIEIETLDKDQNMVSILRKIPRTKSNQLKINGKNSKINEGNQFISNVINMPLNDFQIVTSSEVMTHLKPSEFSDFLVKYIPEKLNFEQLVQFDPTLVDAEKQILRNKVKDSSEITIQDIKQLYKEFRQDDLYMKREIERLEALVQTFQQEHQGMKVRNMEDIKKELDTVNQMEANLIAATKRALTLNQLEKTIRQLKRELDKKQICPLKYSSNDYYQYIQKLQDYKLPLEQQLSINQNTIKMLSGYIAKMKEDHCPLHKDIVCQTDKSSVIYQMQENIKNLTENNQKIQQNLENAHQMINQYQQYYQQVLNVEKVNQEIALKQKELQKNHKLYLTVMEEKVTIPNGKGLDEKKNALLNEYQLCLRFQQNMENEKSLKQCRQMHEYYIKLIKFLAMDGIAIQKITEYYLSLFNQTIAERVKLLNIGLNIQFVLDDGISYRVYKQGIQNNLEYEQLSTGEKKIIAFLILDLLNILSGARLMFLDDLNDLDTHTFIQFIQMITNPEFQKYYDHIFIGTVLNSDFCSIINQYKNEMDFIY